MLEWVVGFVVLSGGGGVFGYYRFMGFRGAA